MNEQEIIKKMAEAIYDSCGIGELDYQLAKASYNAIKDLIPQWQPIESAPRDGSEVYVWVTGNGNYKTEARFLNNKWHDYRVDNSSGYGQMEWSPIDGNITHWMPLPQPPETEA